MAHFFNSGRLFSGSTQGTIINTKKRLTKQILHDKNIDRAKDNIFSGISGQMSDLTIREVAEVGFSPYSIFKEKIGLEYNHITSLYYENFKFDKILETFKEYVDFSTFEHKSYVYLSNEDKLRFEKYYFSEKYGMFISIEQNDTDCNVIILMHKELEEITKFIAQLEALRERKKKSMLNIICFQRNFYLESFELKAPMSDQFDFFDCYNEEFHHVATEIEAKLSVKNGKGIVLIHGGMGNGKTTFLRKLITSDLGKQVIYMPPDLADRISSPEFVTFLMENPNSILIIEDAENILRAREAGGSQAVSNLLNVSDGILGDALHLQIVCTFNCGIEELDKALLRPGRLIAEYRFDKLKRERATKLIKKVYGDEAPRADEDMSLAEIFNMKEELIKTKENRVKFGFSA